MLALSFFRVGKEPALRSFTEIQQLLQQGKKHIVKNILRENSWPINSPIRSQLWPILCAQHLTKQNMLDGFYWEMVHQVIWHSHLIIYMYDLSIYEFFLFRFLAPQSCRINPLCCPPLWMPHIASRITWPARAVPLPIALWMCWAMIVPTLPTVQYCIQLRHYFCISCLVSWYSFQIYF